MSRADNRSKKIIIKTKTGIHKFNVEIADSFLKKAKGLMFRKSLQNDRGMLFINDHEKIRGMWMFNTWIPLDIIFLDRKKRVVDIKVNARPGSWNPFLCEIITSKRPAQNVLEFNAGTVDRLMISEGNKVFI